MREQPPNCVWVSPANKLHKNHFLSANNTIMLWYCTQLLNIHLCELCRKDEQGECEHMKMPSISGDCQPSASLIESRDRNGVSTVNAARKTHPDLSELQKLYSSTGLWQFSALD